MADRKIYPVDLSIVIPAFNEEDNLNQVVENCLNELGRSELANTFELLIVNDGSQDDTGKIADELSRRYSQVVSLHHPRNQGLGAALRTGFRQSRGRLVTLYPGDGEFDIHDVLHLYREIGTAALVVSKRRPALQASSLRRPLYREVLSFGHRIFSRLLVNVDTSKLTGLYLVDAFFLRQLRLTCNTGNVGLQIYRAALRQRRVIRHTETFFTLRTQGSSKVANLRTILKVFAELIQIRLSA